MGCGINDNIVVIYRNSIAGNKNRTLFILTETNGDEIKEMKVLADAAHAQTINYYQ